MKNLKLITPKNEQMDNPHIKERIYTALISNIGGFTPLTILGYTVNVLDSAVKFLFGLLGAFVFTIIGELTRVWLSKQPFYIKYKDRDK